MYVDYDFYQNPIPANSNRKPRLHARVVSKKTASTKELAKEIQDCTTMSEADVNGVLTALRQAITRHLRNGEKVHIEGIGYFELTLSCPPVRRPNDIRAESVRFKSVAFRPDREFKDDLRSLTLVRVKEKRHSRKLTAEEIDQRLIRYFASSESITREGFERLCGQIRSTACRWLRILIEKGKLKKEAPYRYPSYKPANGHYRTE